MRYLILLVALLLTACGKGRNNIDPAFQPLYNQFLSDAKTAGVNLDSDQGITIEFAQLEQTNSLGEVVGECLNVGYGNSTIQIDSNYWKSIDTLTQKILLYHELGHCILDEQHTTNNMAIMNALINNPQAYDANNMPGMIQQLFFDMGDADR